MKIFTRMIFITIRSGVLNERQGVKCQSLRGNNKNIKVKVLTERYDFATLENWVFNLKNDMYIGDRLR